VHRKSIDKLKIITFLIFFLFAFWKFSNALLINNYSLTNKGDGLATLSLIYEVNQTINEKGLKVLFENTFSTERVGFGITAPVRLNPFWKIQYWILGKFFSPNNVYDSIAFFGYLLIGMFGFLVLKELGISFFVSVIGGLLFSNLEHFYTRIQGHLSLAVYYMPLVSLYFLIRAIKNKSIKNISIFGIIAAITFLHNEYYGFFNSIYSLVILILFQNNENRNISNQKNRFVLIIKIFIGIILFIIVMIIFYSDLFLIYFVNKPIIEIQNGKLAYTINEFVYFSADNILALFKPGSQKIFNVFGGSWCKTDVREFTSFRIGIIIPFLIIIFIIFLFFVNKKIFKEIKIKSKCWMIAAIFLVMLGTNPLKGISLVPFTHYLAPMFRVGARSFLFVDISIIIIFCYCLEEVIKNLKVLLNNKRRKINVCIFYFIILTINFSILWETNNGRFFKKVETVSLPDTTIYKVIANNDEGSVIELPFYSPITSSPEQNYRYIYNRCAYGYTLINTPYHLPENILLRDQIDDFAKLINNPNDELVKDLSKTGVKYLISNNNFNRNLLNRLKLIKKIAENDEKAIYKINKLSDYNTESFLETFYYSKPILYFLDGVYDKELNDSIYFRWIENIAKIKIYNPSEIKKHFSFIVDCFIPNGASFIKIDYGKEKRTYNVNGKEFRIDEEMEIDGKGDITIKIETDAKPIIADDPRILVAMLKNYKIVILKKN